MTRILLFCLASTIAGSSLYLAWLRVTSWRLRRQLEDRRSREELRMAHVDLAIAAAALAIVAELAHDWRRGVAPIAVLCALLFILASTAFVWQSRARLLRWDGADRRAPGARVPSAVTRPRGR